MSASDEDQGQRTSAYTLPINKDDQQLTIDGKSMGGLHNSVATSTQRDGSQDFGNSPVSMPTSPENFKIGSMFASPRDETRQLVHIVRIPDKIRTEDKKMQLSTQYGRDKTPSADAIEKIDILLDRQEENNSNQGTFKAIYSSQGGIKKNGSTETRLGRKEDQMRASLQNIGAVQCNIKTEDSQERQKETTVNDTGTSISNMSALDQNSPRVYVKPHSVVQPPMQRTRPVGLNFLNTSSRFNNRIFPMNIEKGSQFTPMRQNTIRLETSQQQSSITRNPRLRQQNTQPQRNNISVSDSLVQGSQHSPSFQPNNISIFEATPPQDHGQINSGLSLSIASQEPAERDYRDIIRNQQRFKGQWYEKHRKNFLRACMNPQENCIQPKTLSWNPARATQLNQPKRLQTYQLENSLRQKFASIVQTENSEMLRIESESQAEFNLELEIQKERIASEERDRSKHKRRMENIFSKIAHAAKEQSIKSKPKGPFGNTKRVSYSLIDQEWSVANDLNGFELPENLNHFTDSTPSHRNRHNGERNGTGEISRITEETQQFFLTEQREKEDSEGACTPFQNQSSLVAPRDVRKNSLNDRSSCDARDSAQNKVYLKYAPAPIQRLQFDNDTMINEDEENRSKNKTKALEQLQSTIKQQTVQNSPRELRALDMMNLMKDFEVVTNQALSSERARNFKIDLILPPPEKIWQKKALMRRHGIQQNYNRMNSMDQRADVHVKKAQQESVQRRYSLKTPGGLNAIRNNDIGQIKKHLRTKLRLTTPGQQYITEKTEISSLADLEPPTLFSQSSELQGSQEQNY